MDRTALIIAIALGIGIVATLVICLISLARTKYALARMEQQRSDIEQQRLQMEQQGAKMDAQTQALAENSAKMDSYFNAYGKLVQDNQKSMGEQQDARLKALEESFFRMRKENTTQMDTMRQTLDDKLGEVYKSLGEMQSVAGSVGDLKKILSNVKTRGILGEIQLAAILEQILNHDQYDENVATVSGSTNRVEFAIRLPGDGEDIVYLPIDSKFPGETYAQLMDAYEEGDKDAVVRAKTALRTRLKNEAKDIHDKYIAPPDTTDFGIMFLPFEGLYAEAVNMGMVEELQREYKVTIAGPTTMAALLNSLQMGFNTLAIEKKSSEVWKTLSEVKKEFVNFADVLTKARDRIRQADQELEKLETTRTNAINRKLRDVMLLDEEDKSDIDRLLNQ